MYELCYEKRLNMKSKLKKQNGSTSVEVIVLLMVFAIVIFLVVVEIVVPNIEEHEKRYIEATSAP